MASSKICKYCEEENLVWAQHCKGCQASLEDVPVVAAPRRLQIPRQFVTALLLCAMAFALIWTMVQMAASSQAVGGPKTLKVLWHKFYGNYGQEWIVGEVRNQSRKTLDQVLAVGQYYNGDGQTVATGRAPLDTLPLGPGKTSHFKIVAPHDPQIEQSWFTFQTFDQQQISYEREAAQTKDK